MAEFPVLGLL